MAVSACQLLSVPVNTLLVAGCQVEAVLALTALVFRRLAVYSSILCCSVLCCTSLFLGEYYAVPRPLFIRSLHFAALEQGDRVKISPCASLTDGDISAPTITEYNISCYSSSSTPTAAYSQTAAVYRE